MEENDVQGVIRAVRGALFETHDPKAYEKLKGLCERLERHQEALRDYRVRLKELGFVVDPSWRAMGAAESNMDKFKSRMGKQGRSWSLRGLTAIVSCMVELFEGKLVDQVRRQLAQREEWILDRLRSGAGRIARQIISEPTGVRSGGFPALQRGTEGYAKLFRQLLQIDSVL